MIHRAFTSQLDLAGLSDAPGLARVELLECASLALEQIVLKAYDERFDDIVLCLTGMTALLRTLGEKSMTDHVLNG
jgi:hypothetical protein